MTTTAVPAQIVQAKVGKFRLHEAARLLKRPAYEVQDLGAKGLLPGGWRDGDWYYIGDVERREQLLDGKSEAEVFHHEQQLDRKRQEAQWAYEAQLDAATREREAERRAREQREAEERARKRDELVRRNDESLRAQGVRVIRQER